MWQQKWKQASYPMMGQPINLIYYMHLVLQSEQTINSQIAMVGTGKF